MCSLPLENLGFIAFSCLCQVFFFFISLQTLILKSIAFPVINLSKMSSVMMETLLSFKVAACCCFILYLVGLALNRNSVHIWIFPGINIRDDWEINLVLVENPAGVNALLLTVLFPQLCVLIT